MSEPDGTAILEYPAESVIVIVAQGRVGATVGRRIAQEVAQALRGGPKAVFFDLEAMTDYHSDMRTHCTQAILSNRSNVTRLTVIAKSKLVKMGVAVANVALGGIVNTVDSRPAFDLAVRLATRG
jgi:hypothetical protein